METAKRLQRLPATSEAFRRGHLSEAQAREITSAAAANPSCEHSLLETARDESLSTLRRRSQDIRLAALPDEVSAYEAIRRRRYLRYWTDRDGAFRLDACLPPDDGAVVTAAIDARKDRIFRDASRAGIREPYHAYAADALVQLAQGHQKGPKALVRVLVDHTALVRGKREDGERCEIPGIGTIPVASARSLATDAVIQVIEKDGVDVRRISRPQRTIPAAVRAALEVRDPMCVVPGCDVREHLQIDHTKPYEDFGPTRIDNLARLCRTHHTMKTYEGFRLGGYPGNWTWRAPGTGARPP